MKIFLSVVLVLSCVGVFIFTYVLNVKTKAPENCPKTDITCAGCLLHCGDRREEEVSIDVITQNMTKGFHTNDGNKEEK